MKFSLYHFYNTFNFYSIIYDKFMGFFSLYHTDKIKDSFSNMSNGTLIDIGGGTGFLASQLQNKFKEITVIDSSKSMLKKAKKRGLKTIASNAYNLPFENRSVDAILCSDALHHIKKIDETIDEMARVITENGEITIVEFHIKGIKGFLFYLFEKIWVDDSNFIEPDQLVKKLEKKGFQGEISYLGDITYMYKGVKQGKE